MPNPPAIDHRLWGWDKLEHAAAYGVFTIFAGWAFGNFSFSRRIRWLLAAAVAVGAGAILEVLQGLFTATRTAELLDLLADAIGAAIVLGWVLVQERRTVKAQRT